MAGKKGNERKNFITWLESPEVGKYSGRITAGIFAMLFLGIVTIIKIGSVSADAVGVQTNEDGINEVRMASIEYVFIYDDSVDAETKEAIQNYCYATMDSVKLLHMVNMRQHIVFTKNEKHIRVSEDGTMIYAPTSVSPDDLWAILDTLD